MERQRVRAKGHTELPDCFARRDEFDLFGCWARARVDDVGAHGGVGERCGDGVDGEGGGRGEWVWHGVWHGVVVVLLVLLLWEQKHERNHTNTVS